jgi:hypothetical protein
LTAGVPIGTGDQEIIVGRASAPQTHAGTGDQNEACQPPELARLRLKWAGVYSITILDGIWTAYFLRTAEEFHAGSARALQAKLRADYARRLEIRPGSPERMST